MKRIAPPSYKIPVLSNGCDHPYGRCSLGAPRLIGCGTGYVSARMPGLDATAVEIDNFEKQLGTAHWLLNPRCELVFLGTHPLAAACASYGDRPTGTNLHRSWLVLHVQDW